VTTTIILTDSTVNAWDVPSDWNDADNSVECYGAGAAGNALTKAGGGGGSWAKDTNVALTHGSQVPVSIGADGQPTWFGSHVVAVGGHADTNGTGGLGGDASLNIGDVAHSGGRGGYVRATKQNTYWGGGGGAGGPLSAGGDSPHVAPGNSNGGASGGDHAGTGAVGALEPGSVGTPATAFGGGGSHEAAAGGGIVIRYQPLP
jgi:hypothetical protein